jgi:hypothetical protein
MTPQKINNNIIEDLVESEREESPVAYIRRMKIRMFNELKEDIQKHLMNHRKTQIKKKKNSRRHRNN